MSNYTMYKHKHGHLSLDPAMSQDRARAQASLRAAGIPTEKSSINVFSTIAALLMAQTPPLGRDGAVARVAQALGIPEQAVHQRNWVNMIVSTKKGKRSERKAAAQLAAVRSSVSTRIQYECEATRQRALAHLLVSAQQQLGRPSRLETVALVKCCEQ
jgi:hypothetical protein